jgi:MFS superfamily sulfate permease-like transporter
MLGITVGAVVVPQGMAYAKLAQLPVEFGLYSSFMGVLIYWFFATSKDITIGPVAVLSTVTGNVILNAEAKLAGQDISRDMIASALAVIAVSRSHQTWLDRRPYLIAGHLSFHDWLCYQYRCWTVPGHDG